MTGGLAGLAAAPLIVVLDDCPDDPFFTGRLIESTGVGCRVLNLCNGRDAIRYLENALSRLEHDLLPFLLLTDLKLEGADGFEVIAWARRQAALDAMRIVVLSGSEDPRHARQATALGADRYVVKFPAAAVFRDIVASARG